MNPGLSAEHRAAISRGLTGHKRTPEEREAISRRMLGNRVRAGQPHSRETREKMRRSARRGPESNFWRGGATEEAKRLRMSSDFRVWREAVFARDDYTCQECGERGGRLHPHHIKRFSEHPELR